jgi:hypothetical protein
VVGIHFAAIEKPKTKTPNMIEQRGVTILSYWGKADPACLHEHTWHLLAGHQGVM